MSESKQTHPKLLAWYRALPASKKTELAARLGGMTVNHVSKNMSVGASWDPERAVILEQESGVPREEIRPDLNWALLRSEPVSAST